MNPRSRSAVAADGEATLRALEVRRARAPRIHALMDEVQEAHTNAANPEEERRIGHLLFVVQLTAGAGSEITEASAAWCRAEVQRARER